MKLLCAAIITLLLQTGNLVLASPSAQSNRPDGRVATGDGPLHLRAGPGLNYTILGLLPDGTALGITARTPDSNWLEVRTLDQNQVGWVYTSYVDVFINLATLETNHGALNFRSLLTGISDNTRQIYRHGQTLGNQPNIFAKVGDSITVSNHMLYPIGEGHYELGEYDYLQPAIDYFSEASVKNGNAFTVNSVAAGVGWTAAAVVLPRFADPNQCQAGETPLACEYRLIHPAFALIMFGTNDVGYVPDVDYRHNLERIVQISSELGVVPVLSTIPPRVGYDSAVDRFNQIVREVAQSNDIPLWDYHMAMAFYAQTSLTYDGVHPSLPALGHDGVAIFKPDNLPYGYVLRNLSALHVLDALWREIVQKTEG